MALALGCHCVWVFLGATGLYFVVAWIWDFYTRWQPLHYTPTGRP